MSLAMNKAGLRDINVRIAEKELKHGEKTGGVNLHGVILQNMFHKNKLGQERLKNIKSDLFREEKEFTKKINQVERKFIAIQVCRKDLNPYITPPKAKVRPKLKVNPAVFSTRKYEHQPFLPKLIKEENIQFSLSRKCPSFESNGLPGNIPRIVKTSPDILVVESLPEINTPSDSIRSQQKSRDVNTPGGRDSIDSELLQTFVLPTISNSDNIVSASETIFPAPIDREVSRLELKQLKSKFNGLRSMMKESHGCKYDSLDKYPHPVMRSPTKHNGPYLCPPMKLSSTHKPVQIQSFDEEEISKSSSNENGSHEYDNRNHPSSCSCHDIEAYNNYVDKLSLELPQAATQKLIKFKHMITDNESIEASKSRLLETNRELNSRCAMKDQRWLDLEEAMKRKPIILEKYRKKSKPKEKKIEKYESKLRFFSAINWMG